MGRITIFALEDCPHCKRVKAAFRQRHVKYAEISLTDYPSKRNDMLKITDRLTVPQVFFNDDHIGGADETIQVMEKWNDDTEIQKILSAPDPTKPELRLPTGPKAVIEPPPPRPDEYSVSINNESYSVLQITETLKKCVDWKDRSYHLTTYKHCATGKEIVESLMKTFNLVNRDDAVAFAQQLQVRHKILHHVTNDHVMGNTEYYYRLQCHHTPNVLNSYRIWNERVDKNSLALLKRLKSLLSKVENAITDDKGGVDYARAKYTEYYPIFEEAVCELQKADMSIMERSEKMAFGINLYNLMIKYAFMKVGIGTTNLSRMSFFNNTKFDIGGHLLSFQDLENGILRNNAKAPFALSLPFHNNDPRKTLAIGLPTDCRIHFALNCGAKSCPPVKHFTAEGIQEELRIVAQAFCEQEDNVRIQDNVLYVSKILEWYRVDFAKSNDELPKKLLDFLRGEKKANLEKLLNSNKKIQIKFNHYDWGTNASDFVPFDSKILKPNVGALF